MKIKHNQYITLSWIISYLCIILLSSTSYAAGLLTPANSNLPELSIRSHNVDVVIEDGYATTSVEQIFHNPHQQDLEAIYSFPIPHKAAVGEFIFWINDQPVVGKVLEKKQAKEIYEKEKQAGRNSALTEQNDYKTFEISVSPVKAGQDVKIKLVYVQKTDLDSGIGRYVYPLEEGGVDEQQLAFWNNNDVVKEQFKFNMTLKSSWPLKGVRVPQQPTMQIIQKSNQLWHLSLDSQSSSTLNNNINTSMNKDDAPTTSISSQQAISTSPASASNGFAYQLNNDLVVYWRLADNLPGAVDMITYKPQATDRGTFMMTLTPGIDLQPINEGKDWIFVLDISGSMQGKYQTLAEGVKQALRKMSPNDRIRVVLFNNRASELTSGYTLATKANLDKIIAQVEAIKPNNGTNVYDGLGMAINQLDSDRTSAIILVTDGVANVGITEQKQFIKLVKSKDVRLFTFIMGNSANRPLLENMTEASGGFAINVSNSDDIVGRILLATSKVSHAALHDINVNISGVKVKDIQPENIGSLYRGEQLILLGHYWTAQDKQATVTLSTKISGEDKNYTSQFSFPAVTTEHPELERLWAYHTIESYQDELDNFGDNGGTRDKKQAIIDIAKEYGLVTNYTSMIVLEEQQFQQYNIKRHNKKRVATEHKARSVRAQHAPQSRRVDTNKPMFSSNRSYLGSGALNFWSLLLILPMLVLFKQDKTIKSTNKKTA